MDRLHSLPDAQHPVTVYKDGSVAKLRFGLPPQDQEIADRLQNLKSYVWGLIYLFLSVFSSYLETLNSYQSYFLMYIEGEEKKVDKLKTWL